MAYTDTTRGKNLALILLAATQFVVILDASIVNVALKTIQEDLAFSRDDISWVLNAYMLTFGGFLLLGGRLADLLGRRRMFMLGLVLFGAASLAGGLAHSQAWLIAARAIQGIGAAMISPAALSILTTTFAEGAERNRALGAWGAAAGSGGAFGVLLGGVLTDTLGWESVLWVNTPIAALGVFLAPRLLAESRDETAKTFDVFGALSVTAGLSVLVFALVDAEQEGWGSVDTLCRFGLAFGLLVIFVGVELVNRQPLMPFSIFRLRTLRGANVVMILLGGSIYAMFLFISLYMQLGLGYSAIKTGLAYIPQSFFLVGSSMLAGKLVTWIGFKLTMLQGIATWVIGLYWFTFISAPGGSYLGDVLVPLLLVGNGLGTVFVAAMVAAITGTKETEAGLASGLVNTTQILGGALGLAIGSTVANSTTNDVFAAGERNPAVALTEGYADGFLLLAIFMVAAAALTVLLISSRDSREHAKAARRGEVSVAAAGA